MLNELLHAALVGAGVAALGAAVVITIVAADHAATLRMRKREFEQRHTRAHNAPARTRTRTHA